MALVTCISVKNKTYFNHKPLQGQLKHCISLLKNAFVYSFNILFKLRRGNVWLNQVIFALTLEKVPSSLGNHILVILACMRLTSIVNMLYYLVFSPLHRIAFVMWLSRFITGISEM